MEMAKVTSKGQITIPVSIRRRLSINEGDKLLFINRPEGVMMVNPDLLPAGKDAQSLQEFESATNNEELPISERSQVASAKTAPKTAAAAPKEPEKKVAKVVEPEKPAVREAEPVKPAVKPKEPEKHVAREAEPVKRAPVIAEPERPAHQAAKPLGGFDVSKLLDEIRSIGSNI